MELASIVPVGMAQVMVSVLETAKSGSPESGITVAVAEFVQPFGAVTVKT
jgi:hypothetical protein